MEKIHVIWQTKKDYDEEQADKIKQIFKFIWWVLCSFLFASIFLSLKYYEASGIIFLVVLVIFIVSDLVPNPRVKAYTKAFLGLMYGLFGIFFIIGAFLFFDGYGYLVIMLFLGGLFLWRSYKNLKKYTNLFTYLSKLFRKRSKDQKSFKKHISKDKPKYNANKNFKRFKSHHKRHKSYRIRKR